MPTLDGPPAWLKPGNQAVILQPWSRGAMRAETVIIERVLKRDVVLSDGSRFRIDRLSSTSGSWGVTTYLVPPTDPRVRETRSKIQLASARSKAVYLADQYRRSEATAREVAEQWDRLADLEERTPAERPTGRDA